MRGDGTTIREESCPLVWVVGRELGPVLDFKDSSSVTVLRDGYALVIMAIFHSIRIDGIDVFTEVESIALHIS